MTPHEVQAMLVAQVEKQWAAIVSADEAGTLPTARREPTGASSVFSVRLDPQELRALQTRAAAWGLRPSQLARNLIRVGLQTAPATDDLSEAVRRVETAAAELRAALP